MNPNMASDLAEALNGTVHSAMPTTRLPGITLTRHDGAFVSLETDDTGWGCGYVFPSQASYDRYHNEGFQGITPDSADWYRWGGWDWARNLAFLLGGTAHQTGGGCMSVRVTRADGRFVEISHGSAAVFSDEASAKRGDDGLTYVEWED